MLTGFFSTRLDSSSANNKGLIPTPNLRQLSRSPGRNGKKFNKQLLAGRSVSRTRARADGFLHDGRDLVGSREWTKTDRLHLHHRRTIYLPSDKVSVGGELSV